MLNKGRLFLYGDRVIVVFLCLLVFCLPFLKAGAEFFVWVAFFLFLLKRCFGYKAGSLGGLFPPTALNRALGVLIAVNVLSVVFSTHLGLSLRGFFGKELKFLAIYFMLVEVVNSPRRLGAVLCAIISSAVLIIVDADVQYFLGVDFLKGYRLTRLTASFISPNTFASWLIVLIPLFLGLLALGPPKDKKLKVLLSLLIALSSVCLVATYARGAWLGLFAGLLFMAWHVIKGLGPAMKRRCSIVALALLFFVLFLPSSIRAKTHAIGLIDFKLNETLGARIRSTLNMNEGSSPIRLKLWEEALKIIGDHPLTGCGLNTYARVAKGYKSFEGGGIYPHNSYLQMAAEKGVLGLSVFFWVVALFFKTGLAYFNREKDRLVLGLMSGILAFLVQAFFDTHLYSLQLVVFFWFMLGLTMAVMRIRRPELTLP